MVETLQIRRTPNNETDYLIATILTDHGTEFIAVNLDIGVAKIVSEPEINDQLPKIVDVTAPQEEVVTESEVIV
ncbi:hypothetical protein LAU42_08805 [Macrococcus armenti]|uniref:hypothetical protein n=1 Tax=Macrococcus armenti TaxID=2875764 RepID=UPI001CCE7692|nr:hypothetical protein [Macrococcus armenti]UBH21865.1 hypothetical protein LAU42_08805 [Macrococcus armenti]